MANITRTFDETMCIVIGESTRKLYNQHATNVFKTARAECEKERARTIDDKILKKAGAPSDWKSVWNSICLNLWFSMGDYGRLRRAAIAGLDVSEEDINAARSLVFECWKSALSFDQSLHATQFDTEMLWLAMEKFVGVNTGQNTPKVFMRLVEREIGVRIAKLEAMTPEQTQYADRLRTVKRSIKAKEKSLEETNKTVVMLKGLKLKGADASVRAFIKKAIEDAEEKSEKLTAALKDLNADKDTLTEESAAGEIGTELKELGFSIEQ